MGHLARNMKPFVITFLLCIFGVFTFNLVMDPLGIIFSPVPRLALENPRNCAVDKVFVPEGAQKELKLWLIQKNKAQNIVVGSSRVQKVNRTDFADSNFVSFSFGGFAIDSYLGLVRLLKKQDQLRFALLGLEFYAFGNQAGASRGLDKLYAISKQFNLDSPFLHLGLLLYELRGSPYFGNPTKKIWDVLTEYLSLPVTKRSISNFLSQWKNEKKGYFIELPAESRVPSRCLYSSTPHAERPAWDFEDASDYGLPDLLGKEIAKDFREYEPEYLYGGKYIGNHWNLMVGFTQLSEFKMAVLDRFLAEMQQRGVRVVGFTPIFPERIMEGYAKIGALPLWNEFNSRSKEVFAKYGHEFIEIDSAAKLGCDDFAGFDDPWHPTRECTKKILTNIALKSKLKNLPLIGRKIAL